MARLALIKAVGKGQRHRIKPGHALLGRDALIEQGTKDRRDHHHIAGVRGQSEACDAAHSQIQQQVSQIEIIVRQRLNAIHGQECTAVERAQREAVRVISQTNWQLSLLRPWARA